MSFVVIRPGSEVSVGRAAGVIYASVDVLYPIVGRFSTQRPDHPAYREPKAHWCELQNTLHEVMSRCNSGWQEWAVFCDETNNYPSLVEEGRIAVRIFIKPWHTPEFVGGNFILGRVEHDGRGCLEVEYRPLAGAS